MSENDDFIETTVRSLLGGELDELALKIVTGDDGLDRTILRPRVQKPGLAFAGYYEYIKPWRVQIIGESETKYLQSLPARLREKRVRDVAALDVSCFIVTKGITPLEEFKHECEKRSVPLFSTPAMSSTSITRTTYFLEETMAPKVTMHSGLLDVYGIGVLLLGDSGIGKSECALDLIRRGHRLVADDTVEVRRVGEDQLTGCAPELLREHMEIRGLGIINIRDLFGVSAIWSGAKVIGLSIRLERWGALKEVDRLGVEERTVEILGVRVPQVLLPVSPGRNLATLVETAMRVHLLRVRGYNAARDFVARHDELLARTGEGDNARRAINEVSAARDLSQDEREKAS
jgi:HPr kinase/phosphorylase